MTIVEQIAHAHRVSEVDRPTRSGDFVTLRPRHVMTHDNTAAVMKKFAGLGRARIHDSSQPVWPMDHDVQNRSKKNREKYAAIRAFAKEQGVDYYPPGTGIGHQIMMSEGYVTPGSLVVASDSHANMYGAVGALGTPVVRTDAAAIWATGHFWWQIPETVQVTLDGALERGVTGKDVILTLCAIYRNGEVLNRAIEFGGPGVATLSMDARKTIANMTTEWGALTGWFPVDSTTIAWFEGRSIRRIAEADLQHWELNPPRPGPDARYVGHIDLDLAAVRPFVSGPDSVQVARSVQTVARDRVAIQKAYLVSCVNSRLSDLEEAASVLAGKHVADGVDLYVAAASRSIEEAAEASGAWTTLLNAGAHPLPSGCGPCIGLGEGLLEAGEVGISATNRNFKGRMGSRDAQAFLASPRVVAASALAGFITGPDTLSDVDLPYAFVPSPQAAAPDPVEVLDGFPETVCGRMVLVLQDNLNTDGIYGKDFTYRDDMTPADMAGVVMRNYDPTFAGRIHRGDILVGGFNFGTGSSREQAATALQHAGVGLVIAGSFSQTYLRNAFNNGLLCVVCPSLVTHALEVYGFDPEAPTTTPEVELSVDFQAGSVTLADRAFAFMPPGTVAQRLVIAGGIEPLIRTGDA